jgi:hypothetical protein
MEVTEIAIYRRGWEVAQYHRISRHAVSRLFRRSIVRAGKFDLGAGTASVMSHVR